MDTAAPLAVAKANAKDRVRGRLADVIGKWWCSHGPLGKRLLGALLLHGADVPDQPELVVGGGGGAKRTATGGARVTVVRAGTGKVVAYGYALPSTGRANAILAALRPMMDIGKGHALRLFCGHDGPELRPDTAMETFVWPKDRDKELVMMPYKQVTGSLGALGRATQHTAVHAGTNTIATVMDRHEYVTIARLSDGTVDLHDCGKERHRSGQNVETLAFSSDGSVLIVGYKSLMLRFFAVPSGQLLESAICACAHAYARDADYVPAVLLSMATTNGRNGRNAALSTADTFLCVSTRKGDGRELCFMGVSCNKPPAQIRLRNASVDMGIGLVQSAKTFGFNPTAATVRAPDGEVVGVCATVHRGNKTRVRLMSLRTGHVQNELCLMDGEVHIVQATDSPTCFWTVQVVEGKQQMQQLRLKDDGSLAPEGPRLTAPVANDAVAACHQIPHEDCAMLLCSGGIVSVVQQDGVRNVGKGRAAWPLGGGWRFVLLETNGSLTVVRL
jgi:hypothetical protein